ncbi:uncharacterized protein LOC127258042 isoform X2 [Andrographis paniculata]|uniref:uncharacterized protein LOC127258042 isoform X2 n=1 Tax=Andrographis paniculata TaxID=175694 RepID=UPI0021E8B65E|nr:uncharacterized protein LOC127258042 isoform X2 [Andrographis paniculata]
MKEVLSSSSSTPSSCSNARALLLPHLKRSPLKVRTLQFQWRCSSRQGQGKTMMMKKMESRSHPCTYTSRLSTNIPLYEIPGASFDEYLEDKPRVFRAIFPDKRRSHQLNEEEWRVYMLPINFLFLTVSPVVDMRLRCKSTGLGYPPGVPLHISKVLELDIIRWELQGLDDMLKPSQFSLGVKGALYSDRSSSPRSRLKGQLEMTISFVVSPVLALVPEDIRRDVAEFSRDYCKI